MKTIQDDKFKSTRRDLRPNQERQEYPYARRTTLFAEGTHIMRGDACDRSNPEVQRSHEVKTRFLVDYGERKEDTRAGEFTMDGELSFEDFVKWRNNELGLNGLSEGPDGGPTGGEAFIRVKAMELLLF